jgi:thioredoxin 1
MTGDPVRDTMNVSSPASESITRESLAALPGPVVVEFGATWCGHCQALAPQLRELLTRFTDVRHIKIEDGKGQPLGRSFRVTLWPTLVFQRDGVVRQQLVRPSREQVEAALTDLVQLDD